MSNYAGDDAAIQLQDLMVGTENVEDFLDRLAEFSASTLSHSAGADIECGVTLQRPEKDHDRGRQQQPRAVILDRIEQSLGDGPCIEALRTTVRRPARRRRHGSALAGRTRSSSPPTAAAAPSASRWKSARTPPPP